MSGNSPSFSSYFNSQRPDPTVVIDPATGNPVATAAPPKPTGNPLATVAGMGAGAYGASKIPNPFNYGSIPEMVGPAPELVGPVAPVATEAISPWAASGIGSAGNYILPAAGAVGALDLGIRRPGGVAGAAEGAASGAAMGSYLGPWGAGIGAGVGALYGGFNKATGKDQDQIARDNMRSALQEHGFIDQGYNLTLADGKPFNMGMDGGATIPNWDGKGARPYYNTDTSNPMTHQTVGWVNPIAELLAGKNDKLRSDLAGYLTNAATSNASTLEGVRSNVMTMMQKLGLDETKMRQGLGAMLQSGEITQQEHDAYQYGIGTLLSGDSAKYEYADPSRGTIVNLTPAGPVVAPPSPIQQPQGGPILKQLAAPMAPPPAPQQAPAAPPPTPVQQAPTSPASASGSMINRAPPVSPPPMKAAAPPQGSARRFMFE